MGLTGFVDYAIDVYGKEILKLSDDIIGMHLAITLNQDVIISDNNLNPFSWMLLRPDGKIIKISVNIEKLDKKSILEYQVLG